MELEEVVQLFLTVVIPKIRSESEVPNVFFQFPELTSSSFFDQSKTSSWTKDCSLSFLINQNRELLITPYDGKTPVIIVHDSFLFFHLLTEITNSLVILYQNYGSIPSVKQLCLCILTRIWLRMSPTDFQEVERFLTRQLEFIQDDTFSIYIPESILITSDYWTITLMNELNNTYDESTRKMQFTIYDDQQLAHTLPNIYYDILNSGEEKICYIYAIQNRKFKKVNPKLERLLYQINEGIIALENQEYLAYRQGLYHNYYPENIVDVHPAQVISLLCFISLLKRHHITKVKVPILQVLSYDFHILLSNTAKQTFPQKWSDQQLKELQEEVKIYGECLNKEYLWDKNWYEHIVDKEDFISCAKTETFLRIFRRASYHDPAIHILTDPLIESDTLEIRLEKPKQKVKNKD